MGGFVGGMLALDAVFSTACEPISAHCCIGALIDNIALISHIQTWHHQGSGGTLAPEYDLLQVAKGIMAKHKLVVKPEHIKSQQDNDTEYAKLPWKAQLNCDCDQLAGFTRTCPQCLEALPTSYIPPTGHIASLEIDGTFITSHIASAIKEASLCSEFTKYVIHKAGWQDPTIFHSIDWEARARASLHSSPSQHLTIFNLNLQYLLPCLADTGWKSQLTIDNQDGRGFRKPSPMCFSAHIVPVFVQQLGLRLFLPLRKHLHVHS